MERGWVYVLVNSSLPHLSKVGRTARLPAERAAELSGATGVATPFVVAFDQEFGNCVQAERDIHAELDRRGLRWTENKEFFVGSVSEIVRIVLAEAARAGDAPEPPAAAAAAELLAEGDRHLYGQGETFEDITEALRLYRLAAARGSLVAIERLGSIHLQLGCQHLGGKRDTNRKRAMSCLKEGARRGNYYCFVEMAALYAREGHPRNFAKAWERFFADRAARPCPEAEAGADRYAAALQRYVCGCIDLQAEPAHLEQVREVAEELLRHITASLERCHGKPRERQRAAAALRWTYERVVPLQPPRPTWRWRLAALRDRVEPA